MCQWSNSLVLTSQMMHNCAVDDWPLCLVQCQGSFACPDFAGVAGMYCLY